MTHPVALTLPPLHLADWRATRDRLHGWARYAGAVRRQLAPPRLHGWHGSLQVSARGVTTGPFPVPGGEGEIVLDLVAENLLICASDGWEMRLPLAADPVGPARQRLVDGLAELQVSVELPALDEPSPGIYDPALTVRYLRVLSRIHGVLRTLQAELELESDGRPPRSQVSPVQLWPQPFALALTWFSGRTVRGRESAAPEERDEQVGLGFSTGEGDADPYLYGICHPWPKGVEARALALGRWHTPGWRGAVLPWREAVATSDPLATAAGFWREARALYAADLDALAASDGPSPDPRAKAPSC
jgi:hypothetical protein